MSTAVKTSRSVMVIDNDAGILRLLDRKLGLLGLSVVCASSAREGLELIRSRRPDLILCDWILGVGMSGIDFARALNTQPGMKDIPIILMSSIRENENDEAIALEAGARLFMTKDEITAPRIFERHIKGLLVRSSASGVEPVKLSIGPVVLIPSRRSVSVDGKAIPDLARHEFDLLALLMQDSPKVVLWNLILEQVWGQPPTGGEVLKAPTHVKLCLEKLRHKLGPAASSCIVSHRGEGLQFRPG